MITRLTVTVVRCPKWSFSKRSAKAYFLDQLFFSNLIKNLSHHPVLDQIELYPVNFKTQPKKFLSLLSHSLLEQMPLETTQTCAEFADWSIGVICAEIGENLFFENGSVSYLHNGLLRTKIYKPYWGDLFEISWPTHSQKINSLQSLHKWYQWTSQWHLNRSGWFPEALGVISEYWWSDLWLESGELNYYNFWPIIGFN